MAIVKLTDAVYDTTVDWEDETISINLLKDNVFLVDVDDYSGGAGPLQIDAGSYCDVEGLIYNFTDDEAVATPGFTGKGYLYLDGSLSLSQAVPTYDTEHFGYYNAGARALMEFDYTAATYSDIFPMDRRHFPGYMRVGDDADVLGDIEVKGSSAFTGLVTTTTATLSAANTFNGAAVFNGAMTLAGGQTFTNSGTITSNGAINLDGTVTLKSTMDLNANGSYDLGATGTRLYNLYSTYLNCSGTITSGNLNCSSITASGTASAASYSVSGTAYAPHWSKSSISWATTYLNGGYWRAIGSAEPASSRWAWGAYNSTDAARYLYVDYNYNKRKVSYAIGTWS